MRVWVGGCTGLSGLCRALVGRVLLNHLVSLVGVFLFVPLILQILQAFSSGLFSSYVQLEQVHVEEGGVAWCC